MQSAPVCVQEAHQSAVTAQISLFLYIDKLQIYMLGSPLLAPPSRALDLTGGLQAGHLSPENLDLSALGLHGTRAGVGGAGGTEGVRAAVEGIRECAARRPAV